MIGHVESGIWMLGRFSIGWNFHQARQHTTIALPVAISVTDTEFYLIAGPVTFIWIRWEGVRREVELLRRGR